MRAWVFGWMALFGAAAQAEQVITLRYNERPPFQVSGADGELHGLVATPVIHAFIEAGVAYRTELTPTKRQTALLVENREPACLLGRIYTPERTGMGKFSAVLYRSKPTIAVALAGNDGLADGMPLRHTFANKKLRLLSKEGYAFGAEVTAGLNTYRPVTSMTTAEARTMLDMLLLNRADYFLISQEEAEALIDHPPFLSGTFKIVHFADGGEGIERRLWCTAMVSDNVMDRLNAVIRRNYGRKAASPAGAANAAARPAAKH